jgi:hypothetical protein
MHSKKPQPSDDRIVTVLHLSDLHFEEGNKGSRPMRREEANRAMFGRLERILREGREAREEGQTYDDWTPDLVAISGDIGYTGQRSDYSVAKKFVEDLLNCLNLSTNSLVLCPGNHDRDWARVTEPLDGEAKAIYPPNGQKSDALLCVEALTQPAKGGGPNPMVAPFGEFANFCEEVGSMRPEGIDGLEYLTGRCETTVRDLPIEFIVVNSAWLSAPRKRGGADPQNMWLGLPLLEHLGLSSSATLAEASPNRLYIGLCHHPLDWLNPAEFYGLNDRPATYRNLTQNTHAVLSGHVHSPLEPPSRIHNYAQVFTGGAVYTREDDIVSSNLSLLKFDLDDHSVGRRGFELRPPSVWEELEASAGTYHLYNNDTIEDPVTDGVTLDGEWESVFWQELKPSARKREKSITLLEFKKKRDQAVRYRSGEDDAVLIRGELKAGYFSGYWSEDSEGLYGTFQVKVIDKGKRLIGRWVGFDKENRILSGYWRFRRR